MPRQAAHHRESHRAHVPSFLSRLRRPTFSVVICSIDSAKFQRVCASFTSALSGFTHELIGIHDARSLAEGYNRGLARARGRYVIFSHDDIRLVTPEFAARLKAHLRAFDLVGVAGTTRLIGGAWFLAGDPFDYQLVTSPHRTQPQLVIVGRGRGPLVIRDAQALDGLFIAARAEVARRVKFDATTFDGFHLYDLDFSFRAYLEGYRLAICRDLFIVHESHGTFNETWQSYRGKFEQKFKGLLADPPEPICGSPISNWLLDEGTLVHPDAVRELCSQETLARLLPQ